MQDRNFQKSATGLCFLLLLAACGTSGVQTDTQYNDADHDKMYKNGSVISDKGGTDVLSVDGGDSKAAASGSGIGVNGFLWRASLDTISFMPIASADPFGGIILTDWYSSPSNQNERMRLNIFIRDRDLRADGVKVSVFRQVRDQDGHWIDAAVAQSLSSSMENAILTKARQIRLSQKAAK